MNGNRCLNGRLCFLKKIFNIYYDCSTLLLKIFIFLVNQLNLLQRNYCYHYIIAHKSLLQFRIIMFFFQWDFNKILMPCFKVLISDCSLGQYRYFFISRKQSGQIFYYRTTKNKNRKSQLNYLRRVYKSYLFRRNFAFKLFIDIFL